MSAAAWLDPSIITKKETLFLDVDLDRGAGYGNTLSWADRDKPKVELQPVEVQDDLDTAVTATHKAFELDADQVEAVVYGGTGR